MLMTIKQQHNAKNMVANNILSILKNPAYQELNAYYQSSTVFNILGLERNENRHSAFIAWLLNPAESHQLGVNPLKQFLSLVVAHTYDQYGNADEYKCYYDVVRQHLLTGNYRLEVDTFRTEQSIIGLARDKAIRFEDYVEKTRSGAFSTDSQNRFDIWMLLKITFEGDNGTDETWTLPLVVENKIYSKEGNAGDKDKAQTVRYKNAMGVLQNIVCENNNCQPLMVYLTPDRSKPTADDFVPLSYQDLLDYVITPSSIQAKALTVSQETKVMLDGYIRNLSCPTINSDADKSYSILAIEKSESEKLECIYAHQAFKLALCSMYHSEAQLLLENDYVIVEDEQKVIEDFWNVNENLFKVVLYNHFKDDAEKMKVVRRIIRVSNRDNTRYIVIDADGNSMNQSPASKSESAFLIFKAYCQKEEVSLDRLREAFPCKEISTYYYDRYLQHLFYDFENDVKVDSPTSKWYDKEIQEGNTWDFYGDDAHVLPCKSGRVRNVKMWRKADFDKLVEWADKYRIKVIPE